MVELGECINNYRKQKLIMAPGSEPESVKELTKIIAPYVYGNFCLKILLVISFYLLRFQLDVFLPEKTVTGLFPSITM